MYELTYHDVRGDRAIIVDGSKCSGCLNCVLRCSFRFEKVFNPVRAKMNVVDTFDRANAISFSEECDGCGICARYCPYDALKMAKKI